MPLLQTALHHPRKLPLRRALFQVHLWLGILLSVYVALIGLSGSILVFEDELRAHATRDLHVNPAHLASPQQVLANAATSFPKETPFFLSFPSNDTPAYTLYLRGPQNPRHTVLADATDAHLLPNRPKLLIDTVHDFHVYLLMGQTGFVINCVAGIGLLVLALTGAILWWPGLKLWARGLRINFRANWKRITYDSHNLIGIATLAIVAFWGLTAIDFLWPTQTAATIAFFSPLQGMKEPKLPNPATTRVPDPPAPATTRKPNSPAPTTTRVPHSFAPAKTTTQQTLEARKGGVSAKGAQSSEARPKAPLTTILETIQTLNPTAWLSGISLPATETGNFTAYVDTRTPGDYSHRDIHTFNAQGQLLTTWHYGQNHTLGDWILWLVYPLHFGTLWGLPVKILWSLLGLSLPILAATGLLMYWNRYLSKRIARDKVAAPKPVQPHLTPAK